MILMMMMNHNINKIEYLIEYIKLLYKNNII
jgi:hypothetical protein